jgi:hypothetical protein
VTSRSSSTSDVVCAGVLAAFGYAVAAWELAALSWDGSWYLFRSLQDRVPFIPHWRYGTYPVLWLLVQAAKMGPGPRMLGAGYGLLLALYPLGSLALSWHFLRGEKYAPLRIWPALGILLTPLPGQLCLISEGMLAAQLMWPVLAILATGPRGFAGRAWLVCLAACLCFLHPTAALIFALAAVVSGWQAWTRTEAKTEAWIWAGVFGALTIGELVLTNLTLSDYERGQMTRAQIVEQLRMSVLGFPLLLLVLVYLLGGIVLLAQTGAVRRWLTPRAGRWLAGLLCAALLWGGLRWAANPAKWRGLLDYRRFVLPAALPLVAMGYWHYRRLTRTQTAPEHRAAALPLAWVAAVFCAVLILQSMMWGNLIARFGRALGRRPAQERFVTPDELAFTQGTNLGHWTACPLSILLQGRHPRTVFVLRAQDIDAQSIRVDPWDRMALKNGWFELQPLSRTPAP